METYFLYFLAAIVAILISAVIYRMIFSIPTIVEQQAQMIKSLAMIVEELRGNKGEYPNAVDIPFTNNDERNSIIATRIETLKRKYKEGKITATEYTYEMYKLSEQK